MPSDASFCRLPLLRACLRQRDLTLNAAMRSLVDTSLPKTFARPIDDIEVRILQIAASVS